MTENTPSSAELLAFTTEVVAAHLGNNAVSPADVPALIKAVHDTLAETSSTQPQAEPTPTPAVPIKKSVQPDYLVCLEDGKKLKTLKRHLFTSHDMTPEEYREKWGLNRDYPMVAPNYAQQRSELATRIGLGKRATKGTQKTKSGSKRQPRRTRKVHGTE